MSLEEILSSKVRVRIIKILAEKGGEVGFLPIVQMTKSLSTTCDFHLKKLINLQVVQEKIFGNQRTYHIKTQLIKDFFEQWKKLSTNSNGHKIPIEETLSSKVRVRIIKILAEKGELNTPAIAKLAKMSQNMMVEFQLKKLIDLQVVQEKILDNQKNYKLKVEIGKIQALKKLFESFGPTYMT